VKAVTAVPLQDPSCRHLLHHPLLREQVQVGRGS
jgi:hypothetical protein